MSLDKAMKNLKFDVRMTEYNLNNGVVSKEELQQHLSQLADSKDQAESLKIDEGRGSSSEGSHH